MGYLSSIIGCLSLIASARASHPAGTYACRASADSGGTLVFAADQQTVRLSISLGRCSASADVPYTMTAIGGSGNEFWVEPDYSSTNFKTAVNNCGYSTIHGDSFNRLRVESRDGVSMSDITVNVGSGSTWEFWLSSRPAPTAPATTAPTPRPLTQLYPIGAYGCRGTGQYGRLDFEQDKQVFRISATLGSCGATADNVPYTMTPIQGSDHEYWLTPDYSSTDFKARLAACGVATTFFDSFHVESNNDVLMRDIVISEASGSPWNCWLASGPTRPVPGPTERPPPVHTTPRAPATTPRAPATTPRAPATTRAPATRPPAPPASGHPEGSFYVSVNEKSGGSLVFHQQQQTLSIVIRLGDCVASAYNVPYGMVPSTNGRYWVVPDYRSTNFNTKLDSCNDKVVSSVGFRRLEVSSTGGVSMNLVTASILDDVEWVFRLAGAPPPRPTHPTQSPATPTHETHPVGVYQGEGSSSSGSTIEFYENFKLMSLTFRAGGVLEDEFVVVPDLRGTHFETQLVNCGVTDLPSLALENLIVSSKKGVPMSEVIPHNTNGWEFELRGAPSPPPPTTTPIPTTTSPTPTAPTKPHPYGLYDGQTTGATGELVFLQEPGNFTMHITLGGCSLNFDDIPYEMVEENGVSWMKADYSSTTLAHTLRNCRFYANSRYELEDLEKIEFRDAQDPLNQQLVIYRLSRTNGMREGKVFGNN
ncbi:hypothetical protein FOZ61_001053 [Perkinsus olseni]|uniref:Protein arginine methyltransferase 10 n=1 Tax=Perkinsus olseni TaxID=32597 RepID=A0A7J6LZ03_PEROL|nr:hypothetical protein FOZ61_001053 [Perkinsus olseni]